MARDEQHIWGREHRRDGTSEWPSTSFSTINDEPRESRPPMLYRRHKKSSYFSLAIPLLLMLSVGFVGVLSLARHFQG
jgi:hypothetical protein